MPVCDTRHSFLMLFVLEVLSGIRRLDWDWVDLNCP